MDVTVENLTKSFGRLKALDSVSFNIKKGEILGFLGPNGAGKSTTLKIMSCYLSPDFGDVHFDSYSIHKDYYKIKEFIGYLPERNPLYDEMNVVDFLKFMAELHGIPRYKITPRVMDMLNMCGLESERHKNIHELSKGFRQRVGLAQALIHDPKVILLDEPTTGLDPNQILEIRKLIKTLGEEKTIIISSHILAEIESTCNRVLIINKGRIVADDTFSDLRRKTSSDNILKLKIGNATNEDIEKELHGISGLIRMEQIGEGDYHIRCDRKIELEKSIFDLCSRRNWYIKEMTPVETRLEDVFLEVTNNAQNE